MWDLTCKEAARILDLDTSCWPDVCIPISDLLSSATFDDEGARACYAGKTWSSIQVVDVLRHPTASCFLSRQGVGAYLPSILISTLFAAKGLARCNLTTEWGHEIRSNREQAFVLLDIIQTDITRVGLESDGLLSKTQLAWITSLVSKVRAIEDTDDRELHSE